MLVLTLSCRPSFPKVANCLNGWRQPRRCYEIRGLGLNITLEKQQLEGASLL